MNKIRAIQELNKKEIENGITPEASWHADYRDTAFIYFGGLPYDLTEGDVVTIFSQFGEPCFVKLARDKETGKSKGFGWLKYEDQRSTDLAVDNLGGADVSGRIISVDHARYKPRDDEDPAEFDVSWEAMMRKDGKWDSGESDDGESEEEKRPMLQEEKELAALVRDHDDEDPMKAFLVDEKKAEVEEARKRAERRDTSRAKDKSRDDRDERQRREDDRHSQRQWERRKRRDDSRDRNKERRYRDDDDDDDDERALRQRRRRDHRHNSRDKSPETKSKRSRDSDEDRRRRRSRSYSPRRYDRR